MCHGQTNTDRQGKHEMLAPNFTPGGYKNISALEIGTEFSGFINKSKLICLFHIAAWLVETFAIRLLPSIKQKEKTLNLKLFEFAI